MPVIQVQPWGEGQGDYVLIEDYDFNPDFHKLLGESSSGSDDKAKLTAAELKAKLTALNIEFKGNASRDVLQELLDQAEADAKVTELKAALAEKGIDFEEAADQAALQALLDTAE